MQIRRHLSPVLRRRAATLALVGIVFAASACGKSGASSGSSTQPKGSSTTATTVPPTSSTTTTTSPLDAPLPQPTAQNPLTILEIGDSLGQDLGFALGGDIFANDPYVKIIQGAKGDTGLSRPDYYNWPAALASDLQQYHPGAVIIFLGGNDGQSFDYNGGVAQYGSTLWHNVYSARVQTIITECLAAKARVLWVGMPIMQSADLSQVMAMLDTIFKTAVAKNPGATYVSSWPVLANSEGQYSGSLVVDGETAVVRDPDGVHLTNAGGDLVASALVAPMEKAWGIKLMPPAAG